MNQHLADTNARSLNENIWSVLGLTEECRTEITADKVLSLQGAEHSKENGSFRTTEIQ